MKKVVIYLFLVSFFLSYQKTFSKNPSDSLDTSIKIGMLNFVNESHYHGKEDPAQKIPILLGKFLSSKIEYISSVHHDSLQRILEKKKLSSSNIKLENNEKIEEICHALPADVVIFGNIIGFNLLRFSVGNPMLAGYGSYKAIVELRVKLVRSLDNKILLDTIVKNKESEKNLDVTLLGKPTNIMREFMAFEKISFESDEFKETLIGKATLSTFNQLEEQIKEVLTPPVLHHVSRENLSPPGVIFVKGDVAYINVGFDDGAKPGDKFVIQRTGPELRDQESGALLGYVFQEIGVVQIFQMESGHLSLAKILKGRKEITVGDLIKSP